MHLNADGDVWVRCCMQWRDPNRELWLYRDDGRVDIVCIHHPDVHLGFDDDLDRLVQGRREGDLPPVDRRPLPNNSCKTS